MKVTNFDFIKKTESRYSKFDSNRLAKRRSQNPFEADKKNVAERLEHLLVNRIEPYDIAKERLIGKNDLMSINYLQLGNRASNAVCRIHVKNINGGNEGYGTGFLITPNLLITNNHVLAKEEDTVNSLAEYNYQYDQHGVPADSYIFEFDADKFFYTNRSLDFSIVYVKPISKKGGKKLTDFGYLKLFEDANKALISEYVSIIQHPAGGLKQIAIRENQVLTKEGDYITYSTDTTQGSSGSPVFNDQWQVVALHHSGVPRKDEEGNYLCKDGSKFVVGMDESLIDWISNEGIRVSSILADLKVALSGSPYLSEILNTTFPPTPAVTEIEEYSTPVAQKETKNLTSTDMNNKITFTIPIEISVGIGTNTILNTGIIPSKAGDLPATTQALFTIEKARNQDYKKRNGYDADFISTDSFKIDLSDILKHKKNRLAPLLNSIEDNKYVLNYFNFSVAIDKCRKLCLLTAVNIDGKRLDSIKRENTKWILDPRMDEKYQTGPTVYANNDLDRGHMVRRLDPVWGENSEAANDDTFHFSNSAPQHKNLNQKTWLSLENYILDNTDKEGLKVSVFTGPVFSDDDIPYRGTLLPLQFWKVAVVIKKNGEPSVSGYMLTQPDNIEDFRTLEGIREDGFGAFKTYQVPLQKIANLTGLAFDKYNQYDPLNGVDFRETAKLIEITDSVDIKL